MRGLGRLPYLPRLGLHSSPSGERAGVRGHAPARSPWTRTTALILGAAGAFVGCSAGAPRSPPSAQPGASIYAPDVIARGRVLAAAG